LSHRPRLPPGRPIVLMGDPFPALFCPLHLIDLIDVNERNTTPSLSFFSPSGLDFFFQYLQAVSCLRPTEMISSCELRILSPTFSMTPPQEWFLPGSRLQEGDGLARLNKFPDPCSSSPLIPFLEGATDLLSMKLFLFLIFSKTSAGPRFNDESQRSFHPHSTLIGFPPPEGEKDSFLLPLSREWDPVIYFPQIIEHPLSQMTRIMASFL